jgi:hypothetical protein
LDHPLTRFEEDRFTAAFGHAFPSSDAFLFSASKQIPVDLVAPFLRVEHFFHEFKRAVLKADLAPYGETSHRALVESGLLVNKFNTPSSVVSLAIHCPEKVSAWPAGHVVHYLCRVRNCLAPGHVVIAPPATGARICESVVTCQHRPRCVLHPQYEYESPNRQTVESLEASFAQRTVYHYFKERDLATGGDSWRPLNAQTLTPLTKSYEAIKIAKAKKRANEVEAKLKQAEQQRQLARVAAAEKQAKEERERKKKKREAKEERIQEKEMAREKEKAREKVMDKMKKEMKELSKKREKRSPSPPSPSSSSCESDNSPPPKRKRGRSSMSSEGPLNRRQHLFSSSEEDEGEPTTVHYHPKTSDDGPSTSKAAQLKYKLPAPVKGFPAQPCRTPPTFVPEHVATYPPPAVVTPNSQHPGQRAPSLPRLSQSSSPSPAEAAFAAMVSLMQGFAAANGFQLPMMALPNSAPMALPNSAPMPLPNSAPMTEPRPLPSQAPSTMPSAQIVAVDEVS